MIELVKKLAGLAKIKELYFESAEAQRLVGVVAPKEVNVDVSYTAKGAVRTGGRFIDAVTSFVVSVLGLDGAPVAKITCKVKVIYQVKDAEGIELTDELATAFADVMGTYNAYPYFREYLQATCGRLGLPQLIAPPVMATELFDRLRAEIKPKRATVSVLKAVPPSRASGS